MLESLKQSLVSWSVDCGGIIYRFHRLTLIAAFFLSFVLVMHAGGLLESIGHPTWQCRIQTVFKCTGGGAPPRKGSGGVQKGWNRSRRCATLRLGFM